MAGTYSIIERPSPNFDARETGVSVDMLVMHYTGMLSGKEALSRLTDVEYQVRAHYMIEEDGRVFGLVDEADRAWHAGVSSWRGRSNCNDFSIGIELEGCVDAIFEEAQYKCLRNLLSALFLRYDRLSLEAVVGHNEIASDRKTDPGKTFEWLKVFKL